MRFYSFVRLLFMNLRSNARNLLMSSIGIVVGTALFLFFLSLGLGVRHVVKQLMGTLPVNQLEIAPKSYSVGVFKVGHGLQLSDAKIEQFRSMEEVKNVFGKMTLRAPAHVRILVPAAGQRRNMPKFISTDAVVQGISPDAIAPKNSAYKGFRDIPKGPIKSLKDIKQPIPVLLSPGLLATFNVITSNFPNFPKINAKLITILTADLYLGVSVYRTRRHKRGVVKLKCRVVGVSHKAIRLGMTIPLPYVRFLNHHYNPKKDYHQTFVSAIVETHRTEQTPVVLKRLDVMGFTLEAGQKLARKIGEVTLLIVLLFALISIVILISAAMSISHVFFMSIYERRYQIGLMRAVGATRGTIRNLVMMESAFVGIFSGLLGLGLCFGMAWVSHSFLKGIKGLPFSPDALFQFPPWLAVMAVGFAILFCLVGSFVPARRAASLDPIQVLSSK